MSKTFKTPRNFYIIDLHFMCHRAFHAPFTNLSTKCPDCQGGDCKTCLGTGRESTKVTYLVTKQILKLLREKKPDLIAVAVDCSTDTLERRKLYPQYKANRKTDHTKSDLSPQIQRVKQIVRALGIPVIQVPGHEADDVIATLVDVSKTIEDVHTTIVTRDKDLMQLIGQGVCLFDPMTEEFVYGHHVVTKFGINPNQIRDYLSLVGDASDNIPGVKGIGPKAAVAVLTKFKKLNNLLRIINGNHAQIWDKTTLRAAGLIREHMEDLIVSRMLVRLNHEVELPDSVTADALEWRGLDLKRAKPIFRMLDFKRWD